MTKKKQNLTLAEANEQLSIEKIVIREKIEELYIFSEMRMRPALADEIQEYLGYLVNTQKELLKDLSVENRQLFKANEESQKCLNALVNISSETELQNLFMPGSCDELSLFDVLSELNNSHAYIDELQEYKTKNIQDFRSELEKEQNK